jgi:hypothetical protein
LKSKPDQLFDVLEEVSWETFDGIIVQISGDERFSEENELLR